MLVIELPPVEDLDPFWRSAESIPLELLYPHRWPFLSSANFQGEFYFPLPRIDGDLRDRLFTGRLSDILELEKVFPSEVGRKKFDDARTSLWYSALKDRLTNFRAMGQLLRGFHNSLHVLKSEVNVFDLLVIECVRMLLPGTYEFIYQNGRYFHDSPGGIGAVEQNARF